MALDPITEERIRNPNIKESPSRLSPSRTLPPNQSANRVAPTRSDTANRRLLQFLPECGTPASGPI